MSLHMNESALWPTIKELLNNHITDSNEMGRLKSWAKVYEADRKSLWKPLSSQVSGHILYVQRWNECGGSSCYSEKIWWQKGPLKHLCTLMKSKKRKKAWKHTKRWFAGHETRSCCCQAATINATVKRTPSASYSFSWAPPENTHWLIVTVTQFLSFPHKAPPQRIWIKLKKTTSFSGAAS